LINICLDSQEEELLTQGKTHPDPIILALPIFRKGKLKEYSHQAGGEKKAKGIGRIAGLQSSQA